MNWCMAVRHLRMILNSDQIFISVLYHFSFFSGEWNLKTTAYYDVIYLWKKKRKNTGGRVVFKYVRSFAVIFPRWWYFEISKFFFKITRYKSTAGYHNQTFSPLQNATQRAKLGIMISNSTYSITFSYCPHFKNLMLILTFVSGIHIYIHRSSQSVFYLYYKSVNNMIPRQEPVGYLLFIHHWSKIKLFQVGID